MIRTAGPAAVLAAICLLVPSGSADATTVASLDRADFAAATDGTTRVVDFDDLPEGPLLAHRGVTFAASTGPVAVTDLYVASSGANTIGGARQGFFAAEDSVTLTFDVPVTAFAIDVTTNDIADGAYLAALDTGLTITSLFAPFEGETTGQVIAVAGAAEFRSVTISAAGARPFTLDTLVLGPVPGGEGITAVPLPATLPLALAGLGLIGIVGYRRRALRRASGRG